MLKGKLLTIRVTPWELDRLKGLSRESYQTMSEWIRHRIREAKLLAEEGHRVPPKERIFVKPE